MGGLREEGSEGGNEVREGEEEEGEDGEERTVSGDEGVSKGGEGCGGLVETRESFANDVVSNNFSGHREVIMGGRGRK